MTMTLAAMLEQAQIGLIAGFAVFLRVGAAMAILPAFGERMIPTRIRLVLTIGFTMIIAPAVAPDITVGLNDTASLGFLGAEVVAGLILGLGLRLLIMALQIAGTIAAQATSLAQIFGAASADPQPAISEVLVLGGLALAVILGFHLKVTEMLILSYEVLPAGQFRPAADLAEWGVAEVSKAFALAFSLAAPFVIASVLYNAALGVINRAMPQLMVAFVGAPAITAAALVLMALSAPHMLSVWSLALDAQLAQPLATH